MRAPLSEIEPSSSGVLKVTRGVWARASLRPTTGCWAGIEPVPGAPGAPGAPAGACGAPDCDPDCWVVCWVPLTGGLAGGKAACQPTMISTETTMATMKFF